MTENQPNIAHRGHRRGLAGKIVIALLIIAAIAIGYFGIYDPAVADFNRARQNLATKQAELEEVQRQEDTRLPASRQCLPATGSGGGRTGNRQRLGLQVSGKAFNTCPADGATVAGTLRRLLLSETR